MANQTPTWLKPFEIKKGQRLSPKTEFKLKSEWVEIPCKNCGEKVRMTKNRAENYWKGYCRNCKYVPITGEHNLNWKDGISKENQKLRTSIQYYEWRARVLVKADFKCEICNKENSRNAHHIKPFALYPDIRFDVNNGQCLCEDCHNKTKRRIQNGSIY